MSVLADFADEFSVCWLCGGPGDWRGLAIHHICRAASRQKSREDRSTLIRTCYPCHDNKLDSMPIEGQLAIKMIHDPEFYDRVAVVNYRGRPQGSITEVDVAIEVAKLWRDRNAR
jgi:hypothetical protein